MVTKYVRPTIVSALLLAILIAVASCSHAPNGSSAEWLTSDQARLEYLDEATKLQLAPGWLWPSTLSYANVGPGGKVNYYGVNTGRVDAAWYWHCSWARTYLTATTERERADSLVQVLRLRESAFYRYGLEGRDRAARDTILDQVAAGDLAGFRAIIDANCPVNSAS